MTEPNQNKDTINTTKDESKNNDKEPSQTNESSTIKEDQPKQLLLEHFSKDELLEKIQSLETELEQKNAQLEENNYWKNKFMRLQAEFENAQKRWNRDRQNLRIQNVASILKTFLPLYDSYKKAIDNDPENEGIKQFYNQFLNILRSQEGMEIMKVKPADNYDYTYHEALSSIEREDLPHNSIVDVVQDGWMLGKEVLRYAKVITSRKPKPPENIVEDNSETECIDEKVEDIENNSNSKN